MSTPRISRRINVPRAAVYRALLDARAVAAWRVPDGMTRHPDARGRQRDRHKYGPGEACGAGGGVSTGWVRVEGLWQYPIAHAGQLIAIEA
jgi:uncharacterized protein YndB with AHSA1/START domain